MRKRPRSHALLREKSAARKAAEQSYSADDICAHNARVYDAEARVRCEYRRAICRIGVQNIAKRARKAASGAEKVAQRRKIQE